eukprot:scaffold130615_cov66-Phaeocystis_antarctica.AAC.2
MLDSFACTLERSGANCEWKRFSLLSLSKVNRSNRDHGAPSEAQGQFSGISVAAGLATSAAVSKDAMRPRTVAL